MNGKTLKYVRHSELGFTVWPDQVELHHNHVGQLIERRVREGEIVSAGFVDFGQNNLPYCPGRSDSLGIGSQAIDTVDLQKEWGTKK